MDEKWSSSVGSRYVSSSSSGGDNNNKSIEDGWIRVGTPPSSNEKVKSLTKSERRRRRRSERRRQRREERALSDQFDDMVDDPILARALRESRKVYNSPKEKLSLKEKISRSTIKINRIKKKLHQIDKLESKEMSDLNDAEIKKIERRGSFEMKLRDEEEIVRDCEAKIAAQRRAMECVAKVQFDKNFACPLCYEVMEAAVRVLPCEHTFCRVCIENALQCSLKKDLSKEKQMEMIRCPICRQTLYDKDTKRVNTKPAKSIRKKISKAKGTCHCGKVVALSSLREHLRSCGDGTCRAMFGATPNLGGGFRQPKLHDTPSSARALLYGDYDEEAELQAALVESMRIAGL